MMTHSLSLQRSAEKFHKMNGKLSTTNELSNMKLHEATELFNHYTHLIVEAKKDLHGIFRRIRNLKDKVARLYPEETDGA